MKLTGSIQLVQVSFTKDHHAQTAVIASLLSGRHAKLSLRHIIVHRIIEIKIKKYTEQKPYDKDCSIFQATPY